MNISAILRCLPYCNRLKCPTAIGDKVTEIATTVWFAAYFHIEGNATFQLEVSSKMEFTGLLNSIHRTLSKVSLELKPNSPPC